MPSKNERVARAMKALQRGTSTGRADVPVLIDRGFARKDDAVAKTHVKRNLGGGRRGLGVR